MSEVLHFSRGTWMARQVGNTFYGPKVSVGERFRLESGDTFWEVIGLSPSDIIQNDKFVFRFEARPLLSEATKMLPEGSFVPPIKSTKRLEAIQGGYIIERTDDYVIDIVRQLFNWRLHVALAESYGSFYLHGYCFFGTEQDTLVTAIASGSRWTDPLNTDPVGYDKKAF